MRQNRRDFITTIAAAGAALPFASISNTKIIPAPARKFPLNFFSRTLDRNEFGFMCECLSEAGIQGLDLNIRPGGKVEPAEVEDKLPKLVEEAKKYNLNVEMVVTGITSAEDPLAERVLKTASGVGVKYYRLGFYEYDYKVGIWESLQKIKKAVKGVAELNMKYKMHGGIQNRPGAQVGCPVWDLHELLRELNPEFAGCQYDVRHAMVEGTNSWILGMRLLAPYIKTMAIKDFTWVTGQGIPKPVTVPVGQGMVNWDLFFQTIKEMNIPGPLTLHFDYPLLENGEELLPLDQQHKIIVGKVKRDVDFVNGFLNKYELL